MGRFLYNRIAEMLSDQIESGVFTAGDRLPSIRQLSQKLSVSIGTIQNAYSELENQGLIEPRIKSGYFVSMPAPLSIPSPEPEAFSLSPEEISVLDLAISVMRTSARKDLIQMGSAVPCVHGSAVIKLHQILKQHIHRIPNYEEDPQGFAPLRRQLARRFVVDDGAVHPDQIIITAGCQESLTIALRCITRPGDVVAVESPCYFGFLQALEVLELKAIEIPVSTSSGLNIEQLETAIKRWNVKGILLNPLFSNPSGYVCSDQKKQQLIELISKYDIPLIEDDVFGDLGFAAGRPRTIHSFDRDGRVILCSSITKVVSPDLKLGWMVPGRYFDKARALKFISTLSSPCHLQFALADFLSTSRLERHIRTVCIDYAKKQRTLVREIQKRFPEETLITQPPGGFLCWVKLPDEIDGLSLYNKALQEGITLAPGDIFSSSDKFRNYIRLNYAVATPEEIEFSIKTIANLIVEQVKRVE